MPVPSADVPGADAPEPEPKPAKSKPAAKPGLADAMASADPLVQKLMWDRGARGDDAAGVAITDAELRKLGFDV